MITDENYFQIELSDPVCWMMRFCTASDEAHYWPFFRFIHLTSYPFDYISWFPLLYACVAWMILTSLRDLSSDRPGQNIWGFFYPPSLKWASWKGNKSIANSSMNNKHFNSLYATWQRYKAVFSSVRLVSNWVKALILLIHLVVGAT